MISITISIASISALMASIATVVGQDACGKSILMAISAEQYLVSPGYPNSYPKALDCQWHIISSKSTEVVVFKLTDTDLDGYTVPCISDFITLYDGNSTSSDKITTYCGIVPTITIVSTAMAMTFVFHSDSDTNMNKTFRFSYISQDRTAALCGELNLAAKETEQSIASPNYPFHHPSDMDCQWVIRAPVSSIITIRLSISNASQSCTDLNMALYDGDSTKSPRMATLCTDIDSRFTSTGPAMTVVFYSKPSHNMFIVIYNSVLKSDECELVNLWASEDVRYITTPSNSDNYRNGRVCRWYIQSSLPDQVIVVRLINFTSESISSAPYLDVSVAIYDGADNDSIDRIGILNDDGPVTTYASSKTDLTVIYDSYNVMNQQAFTFEYSSKYSSAFNEDVDLFATDEVQYFTSPLYPSNYPNNLDCQWRITTNVTSRIVLLKLVDLYTEGVSSQCFSDYVIIYNGNSNRSPVIERLCAGYGTQVSQFLSLGQSMTVVFHSDAFIHFRGFKFEYTSLDKAAVCGETKLTATTTEQFISSPHYSFQYPSNIYCEWIIAVSPSNAVSLRITEFRLQETRKQCTNEYVAFYDGESTSSSKIDLLCGNDTGKEIRTAGNIMGVMYHSYKWNTSTTFRLQYMAIKKPDTCATSAQLAATEQSSNELVTPNYPYLYPSNTDCQWHITADTNSRVVSLMFYQFYLEGVAPNCTNDFVAIYDGSSTDSRRIDLICGEQSGRIINSSGQDISVVFHSNELNNYHGFTFTYKSMSVHGNAVPLQALTVVCVFVVASISLCLSTQM